MTHWSCEYIKKLWFSLRENVITGKKVLLHTPHKLSSYWIFPLSLNTWIWGNHSICGSDIPHINPGTGFPSGPRIPCRAPGTMKRRRVSVLQRASHIKEPPLWRWCFLCLSAGCLTGTSLSHCMFTTTSHTSLFLLQMSCMPSKNINDVLQKQTWRIGVVRYEQTGTPLCCV